MKKNTSRVVCGLLALVGLICLGMSFPGNEGNGLLTSQQREDVTGGSFLAPQDPIPATHKNLWDECKAVPGGCYIVGSPCWPYAEACYYCTENPTRLVCAGWDFECEEYDNPYCDPIVCGRIKEGICTPNGCIPFDPEGRLPCYVIYNECIP